MTNGKPPHGGAGCLLSVLLAAMLLTILGLILAALNGCTPEGDPMQPTERPAPVVIAPAAPVSMSVRLVIMFHDDGTGNQRWDGAWDEVVLSEAERLTGNTVRFDLTLLWWTNDDELYAMNQGELLAIDNHPPPWQWRMPGFLTILISNPDTPDSAGVSSMSGGGIAPWFVMRSRPGDTPEDTARILLHELGHQIGYEHIPNPFLGYEDTADTYFLTDSGRLMLRTWAEHLQAESEPLPPRDSLNTD
jgi:hypothetical protein